VKKLPKLEATLTTNEAKNFVWRTRFGEEFLPSEMQTNHAFNALCLLWSNFKGDSKKLNYSKRFLKAGCIAFVLELEKRELEIEMHVTLTLIRNQLNESSRNDTSQNRKVSTGTDTKRATRARRSKPHWGRVRKKSLVRLQVDTIRKF
jgi:hypothetical protein